MRCDGPRIGPAPVDEVCDYIGGAQASSPEFVLHELTLYAPARDGYAQVYASTVLGGPEA